MGTDRAAAELDSDGEEDSEAEGYAYDPDSFKDGDVTVCGPFSFGRRSCRLSLCTSPQCCLGICCLSACCVLFLASCAFAVIGWSLIALSQNKGNAQDPHTTPVEFPRVNGCAGCDPGNKTNAQLEQCLKPCLGLQYVLDWEGQATELGFKLVHFPSRKGPRGEATVNISAWWLPPPPRPGYVASDQPRVVLLHGLASNNNHCGVQASCFLLRQMGFGCLTPSVRDFGLSGASDHPSILTWAYDYPMDLLGAWDYAINDPDNILGGKSTPEKVGIAGFSKGALGASIAFALEPKVPGAWLDSGPYSGLIGMVDSVVRPYGGRLLTPIIRAMVMFFAETLGGDRIDYYDAYPLLVNCTGPPRNIAVVQGWFDSVVPMEEGHRMMELINGLPVCYKPTSYTPPQYCNGATHHQEMWEFPDDTRRVMCKFWTSTFSLPEAYCDLASLPKYQLWEPPLSVPPGTPALSVIY